MATASAPPSSLQSAPTAACVFRHADLLHRCALRSPGPCAVSSPAPWIRRALRSRAFAPRGPPAPPCPDSSGRPGRAARRANRAPRPQNAPKRGPAGRPHRERVWICGLSRPAWRATLASLATALQQVNQESEMGSAPACLQTCMRLAMFRSSTLALILMAGSCALAAGCGSTDTEIGATSRSGLACSAPGTTDSDCACTASRRWA